MQYYISDVSLMKGPHHLHHESTGCHVTEGVPTPQWAPYWVQRIDLKLGVFVRICLHTVHEYSETHTMLTPTGTMERQKTTAEIMLFRLMA